MNASVLSALAVLIGAIVGGLTSLVASLLTQRAEVRAQELAQDKHRQQELYKEFIEEASKLFIDAFHHETADLAALVGLYAKVSRMRVLSSATIVKSAEKIVQIILDTYAAPNKTFSELREMVKSGSIHSFDPLRDFSEACRIELGTLRSE